MDTQQKYKTFEDLDAYKSARVFRRAMYRVATGLPEIEKFALGSQIRRAAVSLTNNIAEGHGRYHFLDQIKFMLQSRGSLEELIDDLNVCEDEQYLAPAQVSKLKEEAWQVHKILNGYIRYLRNSKTTGSYVLRDEESKEIETDEFLEDVNV